MPVVPGYNDDEIHLKALAGSLGDIRAEKISLLGWHDWGRQKYDFLGRDRPLAGLTSPDETLRMPPPETGKMHSSRCQATTRRPAAARMPRSRGCAGARNG